MNKVISGLGQYVTRDQDEAHVEAFSADRTVAFGSLKREGTDPAWCVWRTSDGVVLHSIIPSRSIAGPFVPPRKRVEGWVNVYEGEGSPPTLHGDRDAADYEYKCYRGAMVDARDRIDCVQVREINPQAEKEAKGILKDIAKSHKGSVLGDNVTIALALLFPECETGNAG